MRQHLRSTLSILALLVGAPYFARAADAPTQPQDATTEQKNVFQDLSNGEKGGKRYRGPAETWEVANMRIDELEQRLAQYEDGKRDDRDGYIILNQLWIDYRGRKKEDSSEAQKYKAMRLELLKKHPEFHGMKDFRLSEAIEYYRRKEQAQEEAATKTKGWVPPDNVPLRIMGNGKKAVIVYQFRLEFVKLPDEYELKTEGRLHIYHGAQRMKPGELKPFKVMTFKRRFDSLPQFSDAVSSNFMICSRMLYSYYQAMTPEEQEVLRARGQGRVIHSWTNQKGAIDQMCSVLSLDGGLVFSFPVKQHAPDTLLSALDITGDGKKAGVMLGEKTSIQGEDGEELVVGKPREVLIWQEGSGLKKVPITDSNLTKHDLARKFALGEF